MLIISKFKKGFKIIKPTVLKKMSGKSPAIVNIMRTGCVASM